MNKEKDYVLLCKLSYWSDGHLLEELKKACDSDGVSLSTFLSFDKHLIFCFVDDPSKLRKSHFNPRFYDGMNITLIEET